MHTRFDHAAIEKKWQEKWNESGIYNVEKRDTSKEKKYVLVELPYPSGNLHIGHWFAFAVTDIYVRYERMLGKDVIFPIGFDAFGLPAENAAIKNNLDPKEWTLKNIEYMTKQLESMGNAFTWNMSAKTVDPDYYRWTQWMFTNFFEKGIAYRAPGTVNWCTSCNTVLSNEQVVNDVCDRCGSTVEKRQMEEWKMRITEYADRLIDDLEKTEWPEHIKEAQRQWIGRSEGAEIDFQLSTGDTAPVFTTRPDTLFGATYMVLAPEHTVVEQNKEIILNWVEVEKYIDISRKKEEQDRLDNTKEKTGVKLEGVTATNPVTGHEIPVYIADYVLASYGTGAIMAVPAHDERDFMFAQKFGCKIQQVIKSAEKLPFSSSGLLMNSDEFDGVDSEEAKKQITEKVQGRMTCTYRLRDWSVGRQRYWGVPIPIVYDPEGTPHPVREEHLPWLLPEDVDFKPTGEPPLAKSAELKERTTKLYGEGWTPAFETMDTFVDSSWYFLRYIDNKNTGALASLERQKEWMPVDVYFGGAEHTTLHLLYSRFWQKVLFDMGLVTDDEPYIKRINRGLVLGPDGNKMSKSKGNVIDPDEQVSRLGADTVKMYLSFLGPYAEPSNYPWDLGGIAGIHRFLEKVYGLNTHVIENESNETTKLLHKTIKKVRDDLSQYKFNTALSALMILVNHIEKQSCSQDTYLCFIRLLAPFAAHLSEELWELAGHSTSVHLETYPEYDPLLIIDTEVTIGVQVDGKMRGAITLSSESSESEALNQVKSDKQLSSKLPETIGRVVYVPRKILNIMSG